jgi:Flp pilus assembly pilin Flp
MFRPSRGHSGQAMVEYSLLIAFICLGCVVAVGYLRDGTRSSFERQGALLGAPTYAPSAYIPPLPTATATATATVIVGSGSPSGGSGSGSNPTATTGAAPTATTTGGAPTATTAPSAPTPTTAAAAPTATPTTTNVRFTAAVSSSDSQKTAYWLKIENTGTTPVSGLKARIYLDLSKIYAAGLTASNVMVDRYWDECASAQFGTIATTNAASYVYYIDVDWSAQTLIVPGQNYTPGSFCNLQFAVRLSTWQSVWNGANDYSYQGTPYGSLGSSSGIPAYRNGVIFSGSQP